MEMIPKINMSSVTNSSGKARERQTLGAGLVDGARTQQEVRSSTPLRVRNVVRSVSRMPNDGGLNKSSRTGIMTTLEDSGTVSDVRRSAEEVCSVLGVNVLQIEDVHALQLKAIEVAERLLRMEEWYKGQLQERNAYVEHRMTQLAAASRGGGNSSQLNLSLTDKLAAPSTIRSRNSPIILLSSWTRPALNASSTPTHRRHSGHSAPNTPTAGAKHLKMLDSSRYRINYNNNSAPLRDDPLPLHSLTSRRTPISRRPRKERGVHSGGRTRGSEGERRKIRSASTTISRDSRGASDDGNEVLGEVHSRRHGKRRSMDTPSLFRVHMTNNTPKRNTPSSGRLGRIH